ncbi:hypothetical protein T265_14560, partial [Opisthorchis viverrini]
YLQVNFQSGYPVSLAAFNVHSLKQAEQQAALALTLDSLGIDVCCASETRIRDASTVIELTPRQSPLASGDPEAAAVGCAGVGIVLSHRAEVSLFDLILVDGPLCAVRLATSLFFSRTLNPSEKNHSAIEKEAYAIVESIRKWRHYLLGRPFKLTTDQRSVTFMYGGGQKSKVKNDKIQRWRIELSEYKYDVIYRPGKDNHVADTLSRNVCASMGSNNQLGELHNSLCHPGITRMFHFVRCKNLSYSVDDVKRVISSCKVCAELKPRFWKSSGRLIKATQPFERLSLDFKGPLPSNTRNRYLLTIIDEFSRFPFAFACADMTSATVIDCLTQIFCLFGMPAYIHSDRGSSFMSSEINSFLLEKGVAMSHTSAYNPQCNGQVERLNGTLWKTISLALKSHNLPPSRWESVLPDALHSLRSLLCTVTNCTPHERLFQYARRSTFGISLPSWLTTPGPVLLQRGDRSSKYQPLVEEVDLLNCNPHYAHIAHRDGRVETVSLRRLAPAVQSTTDNVLNLSESNEDTEHPDTTELTGRQPDSSQASESSSVPSSEHQPSYPLILEQQRRIHPYRRHVSARLHLSSELLSSDVDVHVLVKRLWNSLAQMEVAVLSACRRRLSAPPSTSQELCNSLTALLLLENSSLDQALTEYLKGRKLALEHILATSHTETLQLDGGNASGAPPLPLKKQLALVGKFLMSALETTEYLFLDDGVDTISPVERLGALRRGFLKLQEWKLKVALSPLFYPSLGATWLVGDRLYSHLPPEVINFRLFSATCSASRSASSYEGPIMDLPLLLLEERVCAWWSELALWLSEFGKSCPDLSDLGINLSPANPPELIQLRRSLVLCRSTITKSMSHAPNLNSLVSIRASILPMITKWQKQGSCPARASPTTNSSIGTSRNGCPADLSSAEFTIGHPHVGESILHREEDLWSELFADPFLTHIANPKRQIISNELSFVWSDIKPDVLISEQLTYPTKIGSTKGCKKRTDMGTKTESAAGLHPAATSLTRILRPENIGLIVFCYLTDRSIPATVCVPHDQSETVCAPPPHLLVFLQRLVFDNSSSSTIDLPLPSPSYTGSSAGNRRSADTNQLASRLSLLPSSLQNKLPLDNLAHVPSLFCILCSVCQTFDESVAELVLTVAQSAHQDWLPLWEILVSTLKRAIQRCEDWLITTAYRRSNSDGNSCEQLAVDPMSGLFLARACQALISLCPSIGATIVAGTGVIESATTKSSVGTAAEYKDKDKSGVTKRGFSWSDLSHLRSVWSSVCTPLLGTADRLTMDCLCHATLETTTADTFFHRMLAVISPTSNESVACETGQRKHDTTLRLLIEYGEFDCLSDVVTPFDDIRLEPGSAECEMDENAVAILRVPSSVSLPLHQLLLSTVRTIGQLLVHKVPVPSLNREICLRIGANLLNMYVKLVEHLPTISSSRSIEESSGPLTNGKDPVVDSCLSSVLQPIALQLIFDIRYLMQLLIWPTTQSGMPRSRSLEENATSKELASTIRRKSSDLLSKLEAYVDPFDWEMCHQRLSISITHALNTTSHLYVPLIQPGLAGHIDSAKSSAEKTRASGLEVASLLPLISTEPVKDEERATANFSTLQLMLSSCVDKRRSKLGVHGPPKLAQQHFR